MLPVSRRMRPDLALLDQGNCLATDTESLSYLVLEQLMLFQQPMNFAHIRPSQGCLSVMLPPITLMITNTIFAHVLCPRTPGNVLRPVVVQLTSRSVKRFLTFRTRLIERLKNQVMDKGSSPGPVGSVPKVDLVVAVTPQVRGQQISPANTFHGLPRQRSNSAVVADFVQILPAEDRLPDLVHDLSNKVHTRMYS